MTSTALVVRDENGLVPAGYSSQNTLLEREYGGVRVELRYLPLMDMCGVYVQCGRDDSGQWKTCSKDKALDVYTHPFAYGFELRDK